MYQTIYKKIHNVYSPIHQKIQLKSALITNLGAGRPRRQGRALVSFVVDYIHHLTKSQGVSMWDQENSAQIIDNNLNGKYAGHGLNWESAELIRQLIEKGFIVDCIYSRSGHLVKDGSPYDLFVDEQGHLDHWKQQRPTSKVWFYAVACHWLYWNNAEYQRLAWLYQRRGIPLTPVRQLNVLPDIAKVDIATYKGNNFTRDTFGQHKGKLEKLYCAPTMTQDKFPERDWGRAKKRFVFFGSTGWVHRGLDLVIEAFIGLDDLELLICGSDQGFQAIYGSEVEQQQNIRYLGFINPQSNDFQELMQTSCGVVYPSSAEGNSGSIRQCLHFGLIPIITEIVGMDIHDIWPALPNHNDQAIITAIQAQCREISNLSDAHLAERSRHFWEFSRQHYTREAYRHSLGQVLNRHF